MQFVVMLCHKSKFILKSKKTTGILNLFGWLEDLSDAPYNLESNPHPFTVSEG